jgi:hypothetical protein
MFNHTRKIGINYIQHFKFSINLAGKFFLLAAKATVHSFYPDLYVTSSSDGIKELGKKFHSQHVTIGKKHS